MLNDLDRFHLVMDVIDRVPGLGERAAGLRQQMADERLRHRAYTREHGDDPPDVRDWTWPGPALELPRRPAACAGRQRRVEQPEAVAARRRRRGAVGARARRAPRRRRARGRGGRAGRAAGRAGRRRAPHRARRRALPRRGRDRRRGAGGAARADRARAAAPAEVAGGRGGGVGAHCPDVPAVACFDTAFHATLPPAAATYALPRAMARALRRAPLRLPRAVARVRVAPRRRARADAGRIVTCHLGAGASLCAVLDGRSVDTTMGFTPLEGLVDGDAVGLGRSRPAACGCSSTRACRRDEMADALEHESGLLGPGRHGRHARGAGAATTPRRASRSTSTCTACARRSARWPPRSAGSTRSSSPVEWESDRRSVRELACGGLSPPRRGDRHVRQRFRQRRCRRARERVRASRCSSSARARTWRSPVRPGRCSTRRWIRSSPTPISRRSPDGRRRRTTDA